MERRGVRSKGGKTTECQIFGVLRKKEIYHEDFGKAAAVDFGKTEQNHEHNCIPFCSFSIQVDIVANRTRAQLRDHARQIPLPLSDSSSSEGESEENFEMANPASMLLELVAPRFNPDLLCITYDDDEAELQPRPPQIQQPQQPQLGGMSLEEIVKSMASSTLQFQQETRSGLKNLENQVSQLANTVGRLEAQNSHKFPSQPEKNPR
ncbi:Protein CLASP-2, partial [Bienertia sinuspersici]